MIAAPRADALVALQDWREPEPDAAPSPSAPSGWLRWEAAAAAAAVLAAIVLLAAASLRDTIAFPYSDSHDWAAEVLRTERTGDWSAYLWRPHNDQRMPWARVGEALQIEAPSHPPAFLLMGALFWASGLVGFAVLLARSTGAALRTRLWLGAAGALLLTCGSLAEDFAFPISSIYLFGAGPAVAAACLWGAAGRTTYRSPWLWGAIGCAMLASGGEAAALAIWPALIGAALLLEEDRGALAVLALIGAACIAVSEAGLGNPGGAPGVVSTGAAHVVKMVIYFGSYCGLPWSRALHKPLLGAALGWPVAGLAAWGLRRTHAQRPRADRFATLRRAGCVLALFGLATAVLAALERVDELAQPIVPLRYTPFAVALQLSLLLLYADRIEAWIARRPLSAPLVAIVAATLVLRADVRAGRLLDETVAQVTAASRAFDAGLPADLPMHPRPAVARAVRRALIARGLPG